MFKQQVFKAMERAGGGFTTVQMSCSGLTGQAEGGGLEKVGALRPERSVNFSEPSFFDDGMNLCNKKRL
jgi:hypothetical protein